MVSFLGSRADRGNRRDVDAKPPAAHIERHENAPYIKAMQALSRVMAMISRITPSNTTVTNSCMVAASQRFSQSKRPGEAQCARRLVQRGDTRNCSRCIARVGSEPHR
ncbi:protein of unknown function [Burkholderia multivorans]